MNLDKPTAKTHADCTHICRGHSSRCVSAEERKVKIVFCRRSLTINYNQCRHQHSNNPPVASLELRRDRSTFICIYNLVDRKCVIKSVVNSGHP